MTDWHSRPAARREIPQPVANYHIATPFNKLFFEWTQHLLVPRNLLYWLRLL